MSILNRRAHVSEYTDWYPETECCSQTKCCKKNNKQEKNMCMLTTLKEFFPTNGMAVATDMVKIVANIVDFFEKNCPDHETKRNEFIDAINQVLQAHKQKV